MFDEFDNVDAENEEIFGESIMGDTEDGVSNVDDKFVEVSVVEVADNLEKGFINIANDADGDDGADDVSEGESVQDICNSSRDGIRKSSGISKPCKSQTVHFLPSTSLG